MTIKVHIADDHAVFRCGLRAFIEKNEGIVVVGETGNVFDTLRQVTETEVDVLVLDINMPGMPASELVRELTTTRPELGILILTIHDEEYYLREFLKLGVKGFMVKTSTGDDLIHAIQAVHEGRQFIDNAMTGYLVSNYIGRGSASASSSEALTHREEQVLSKLALGYTNTEAAEELCISPRTVESHRASIMAKLNLKNRSELVRYALLNGLLKP